VAPRPLPVLPPHLAAVLRLAARDSLVDGLVLTAHQQKLLPPLVGIQTEEEPGRMRREEEEGRGRKWIQEVDS